MNTNKSKRANNEGSISVRKRDAKGRPIKYQGSVTIGYDKKSGKQVRKYFYGKTKAEVGQKIQEALYLIGKGKLSITENMTVEDFFLHWLQDHIKNKVRPSTYSAYSTIVERHIIPMLGKKELSKIKGSDLQKFLNNKLDQYSTRYVKHMYTVLSSCCKKAVQENLIIYNPVDSVTPPRVITKKFKTLNKDDLIKLIEKTKSDRLAACYQLLVATGLRRAELLGLCWDSISFEKSSITIQRQLLALESGITLTDSLKTKSSKRTIPIPDEVVISLKKLRDNQAKEMLKNKNSNPLNLVFTTPAGKEIDPREFSKSFRKLLIGAELPVVRLHDVRHSHATLLMEQGINPKVVQERLGHSSVAVTLDLYSHVSAGLQQAATMSVASLFNDKVTIKSAK